MPHTHSPPHNLHALQSISIIILSTIFNPLWTLVAILSHIISPFTKTSRHIEHHRQWRKISSSTFRPRTVLVTGIGTSKGLMLARAFYRAGHNVIGADFEPYHIPVSGRLSKSIKTFYQLSTLAYNTSKAVYIQDLITIIVKEKAELWISCLDSVSAVEEAEAAEVIERNTECRAIQFSPSITRTLRDELSFIKHTQNIGLNAPETHIIASEMEALRIIYPSSDTSTQPQPQVQNEQYTIKPIKSEDTNTDTTVLPLPSLPETESYIQHLNPTPSHPFILQQSTPSLKYITHSFLVHGALKAFIVCASSSSFPQTTSYIPLYSTSALSLAMRNYTSEYARKTDPTMTGHMSLTFRIPIDVANKEESHFGASDAEIREVMESIYAISCDPRPQEFIILLADSSEDLAEIYLSVLPGHEPQGIASGHRDPQQIVVPHPAMEGYYSLGYDVVNLILVPALRLFRREMGVRSMVQCWLMCIGHVLFGREAMWEFWDPWPWWFMYVGYWPLMCAVSLWEGRRYRGCSEVGTKELTEC